MIVLLEASGHRGLAGFRRLLQVTLLFHLAPHGGIPVVLDGIVSPVWKGAPDKLDNNAISDRS